MHLCEHAAACTVSGLHLSTLLLLNLHHGTYFLDQALEIQIKVVSVFQPTAVSLETKPKAILLTMRYSSVFLYFGGFEGAIWQKNTFVEVS